MCCRRDGLSFSARTKGRPLRTTRPSPPVHKTLQTTTLKTIRMRIAVQDSGWNVSSAAVCRCDTNGDGFTKCAIHVHVPRAYSNNRYPLASVGGGGVGTRPRYLIVCLWRRLLASRHCSF